MPKFCPKCGRKTRTEEARFCPNCGYDFEKGALPAKLEPRQPPAATASSLDSLIRLGGVLSDYKEKLRDNTLLAPLQGVIDGIAIRDLVSQASDEQVDQALSQYKEYTRQHGMAVVDVPRRMRELEETKHQVEQARMRLELKEKVKDKDLLRQDFLERQRHEREKELLDLRHKQVMERLELRTQLDLVNTIIAAFNQINMLRVQAQTQNIIDLDQINMLDQVVRESFKALGSIDTAYLEYKEDLEEALSGETDQAKSPQKVNQLIEEVVDAITNKIGGFGGQTL